MNVEISRQLAEDENTAPEVLANLAKSDDYRSRLHVAQNPNTPTITLFNLGSEFPKELLDNPIFDLLFLENPNLIEELSVATKHSLLKCENVPQSLIAWAVEQQDEKLLLALTINPVTDPEIIQNLISSKNYKISEAARLHINSNWIKDREDEQILIDSIRKQNSLLKGDINSRRQLQRLLQLKLIPLILIPLLPTQFKMFIAHDNNYFYLEKIVDDCFNTLENKKDCEQHQIEHFTFKAERILEAVAGNFHAPISILIRLAKIYGSKTYSNAICEKAIYGICQYVSNDLNNRTHILEEFIDDRYKIAWQYIARNILTPKKILRKLTTVSNPPYESLAQNPNTPIRIGLNYNFILNLPSANYDQIKSSTLASQIIQNFGQSIIKKSAPPQAKQTQYSQKSIQLLENIIQRSKKSFSLYRLIPFFHPQISQSLLAKNAFSDCWWERYAIAQNPNTPLTIIQRLAKRW